MRPLSGEFVDAAASVNEYQALTRIRPDSITPQ